MRKLITFVLLCTLPIPLPVSAQTRVKGNVLVKGGASLGAPLIVNAGNVFGQLPSSWVNSDIANGVLAGNGFCKPAGGSFDATKTIPGDYAATVAGLIQAKTDQVAANQSWLLKVTVGTNIHSGTYSNSALITWPTSGSVTKCLVIQSSTHNTDGVTVCSHFYPTTRNANCTNDAGKMWKFTIDNSGGTYGMLFPSGPAYILIEDVEISPAAGTNQSANSSSPQLQLAALGDHFGLAYSWIHGWNPGDAGQPAGACATVGSWNRTGLVDTNGTTVTRHVSVPDSASGDYFGMDFSDGTNSPGYPAVTAGTGNAIIINGVSHGIASHDPAASATTLTIDSSAGTQTGVTYTMVNPATAYANGCGDDSRGIQMNCSQCFAEFNYINKIHWWGGESHALSLGFSAGPVKLVYNYLEAGSNGIFSGGAAVDTRGGPLNDLEVGNTIVSRDIAWKFLSAGSGNSPAPPFGCGPLDGVAAHDTCPFSWAVKNNIELKECNRCVFYAVIVENSWPDGQSGSLFAMTVRVASGGESAGVYDPNTGLPSTMLKNVRIQDFWARNASQFLGFGSRALDPGNGGGVSLPVSNFDIINGLITNTQDTKQWGDPGTDLIQWSTNGQKYLASMSRALNIAHAIAGPMNLANYDPGSGNIHNNYGTYNKAFDVSGISSTAGNVVTIKLNNLRHDPTVGGSLVVANVPGWNGTFTITGVQNTGSSTICTQDNNGNTVIASIATQPQPCIRADGTFGDAAIYTDNINNPGAATLCSTKLGCDAFNTQIIFDTMAYKVVDITSGDGVYVHDCSGGSLGNPALFNTGSTSRVQAMGVTNPAGLVVEYPNTGSPDTGATCVIENSSGWPSFISMQNVTTLSPNITSINSNGVNGQHYTNRFLHNIFAMTGTKADLSCTGVGTEGTLAYACWDAGTFQFNDTVLQGRNSANWSVLPGGAPVNFFPLTVTCSGATATSTCLGYTKWMSNVQFPTTNCDYSLSGNDPTNCPLMAAPWQTNFSLADIVPVASSSYQTQGVDLIHLLNSFAATEYVCPPGANCGGGPKPD